MQITIKVDTKQINNILSSLSTGFSDFRPALIDVSKMQLKEIKDWFSVSWRNINNTRWIPLKYSTVKQKIRDWLNNWILVRTWKMKNSFNIQVLTKNELQIWNTTEYFWSHQTGSSKVPQRQMLWHWSFMIKKTDIIFTDYLLKLIKKWTR